MFNIDHFGIIAPLYEKYGKVEIPDAFITRMGLDPEFSILDVGGGTGRIAQGLIDRVNQIMLVDPSLRMLRFAVRNIGGNCLQANGEQLPYKSNYFDRVIMVDAFHHVFDQQACIQEMMRVTKPNGKVFIIEPDINRFAVKVIAVAEKLLLMRSHIISGERIAAMAQNPGAVHSIIHEGFNVWVVLIKNPE